MAKHGAPEIIISLDDAPGGTLTPITQYVRGDIKLKIQAQLQASHPFGVAWDESTPTGHGTVDDITLQGLFDDAIWAIVKVTAGDRSPSGATRTFQVEWVGGSPAEVDRVECRLLSSERTGKAPGLTEYVTVLRPTGAPADTAE
jgi:hypothetical protein